MMGKGGRYRDDSESGKGCRRTCALLRFSGSPVWWLALVGTHVYWLLGGTWGLYTDGFASKWRPKRCCRHRRRPANRLPSWSYWRGSGSGISCSCRTG